MRFCCKVRFWMHYVTALPSDIKALNIVVACQNRTLQQNPQSYEYAVFLMTEKAVDYIRTSKGWEIGVGPSVVIVDEGVAKNLSTSTLKDDAYAFVFNQQGLMAGVPIEGTKISVITR